MTKFCEVMQEAINNALEGDNMANPLYVAIFGNSDVMKVGDWVPVLVPKRPSPSPVRILFFINPFVLKS